MELYQGSPLRFRRGYFITEMEQGSTAGAAERQQEKLFYYLDYDARSKSVNMRFPHFHVFYEILIPLSPNVNIYVEGTKYQMQPNDIAIVPPSILHQSEYTLEGPSDRILIQFQWPEHWRSNKGFQDLLSCADRSHPVYRFTPEVQKEVFAPINEIVDLTQTHKDSPLRFLMVHTKFVEFMYGLYSHRRDDIYENQDSRLGDADAKILDVTNYIYSHYMDKLTLGGLAEQFQMNPYYLSHKFSEINGFSLVEYIQNTRAKNAEFLLLETDSKVSEIAKQTGFSSVSQFNRVFSKLTGISPTDFRKVAKTDFVPKSSDK